MSETHSPTPVYNQLLLLFPASNLHTLVNPLFSPLCMLIDPLQFQFSVHIEYWLSLYSSTQIHLYNLRVDVGLKVC